MFSTQLLAMATPQASDLWAFYVLAALWIGILGGAWLMVSWFGSRSAQEGHRGL